jgi:hypothetical protein
LANKLDSLGTSQAVPLFQELGIGIVADIAAMLLFTANNYVFNVIPKHFNIEQRLAAAT